MFRDSFGYTELRLESLERRDVPSVSYVVVGTTLVINGDAADNTVVVDTSGKNLVVTVTEGGVPIQDDTFLNPGFTQLEFNGGAGDDVFENRTALDVVAVGGDGLDTLYGGRGSDILRGGNDNDLLVGGGGTDFLFGDAGDDTLQGGSGKNELVGGDGIDTFVDDHGPDIFVDFTLGVDLIGTTR